MFHKNTFKFEDTAGSKQFLIHFLKNIWLYPKTYLFHHCFTKCAYDKTTNKTSQLHRDTQVISDLLVMESRFIISYAYLNDHTFPYETIQHIHQKVKYFIPTDNNS